MSNAVDQVKNAFQFTIEKFPLSGPDGMKTPWYVRGCRSRFGNIALPSASNG